MLREARLAAAVTALGSEICHAGTRGRFSRVSPHRLSPRLATSRPFRRAERAFLGREAVHRGTKSREALRHIKDH